MQIPISEKQLLLGVKTHMLSQVKEVDHIKVTLFTLRL